MPFQIKLNGQLSDEWCVGDQIICTYENVYCDKENDRIEADMLTLKASNWQPTYPAYNNGWTVTASADGKLTDAGGTDL